MRRIADFKTVDQEASYEFIEKHSKFIGYVKPTKSEQEAIDFINKIRANHRQATHNVYAFILRTENFSKFSDDGEPQGTAGLPILDVMRKQEIVDATVVVTRYFGGTLLGTGGLVRAYSKAAKVALDAGKIVSMGYFLNVYLECDYTSFGKISSCISDLEGKIDDSEFTDNVKIKFHIGEENFKKLEDCVGRITSGKSVLEMRDGSFYKK